jgi:microcystin-dependent protein
MLDGSPIATVIAWSGPLTSAGPSGPYLLCDGSAVLRSVYSELFLTIGTTYGNGDNSTTFNLPNIKTRVIAGYDSTDTSFNTIGLTGGSSNITLTANNLPTHTHTATTTSTDSGHSHSIHRSNQSATIVGTDTSTFYQPFVNSGTAYYTTQNGTANISSTTTVNNNTTTNTAINNLQPYIVMRYYIKYTAGGTSFGPTGPTGPTITNATTVTVTDVSNNTTYYPTLTLSSGTNQSLYADITSVPMSYNPSTGALSSTTFVGDLSGNITGGLGGQVLYQSAVNTTAKLANGTAGQVLTSAGTTLAPTWSSLPSALINLIYPIGAIIQSTVSTNPGTYITGTTWTAFGAGQVLVGKATSGTFVTAGSVGGAETVTLVANNLPAHSHPNTLTDPGHSHLLVYGGSVGNSRSVYGDYILSGGISFYTPPTPQLNNASAVSGPALAASTTTGISITNANNVTTNTAVNNLQPYIVVYTWTRTA